jgi:hypothetical protein
VLRSQRQRIVVGERGFQYACNLFPAKQIDGDGTAFTITAMSVDADYEIFVDAAFAFGGVDKHGALKLPLLANALSAN